MITHCRWFIVMLKSLLLRTVRKIRDLFYSAVVFLDSLFNDSLNFSLWINPIGRCKTKRIEIWYCFFLFNIKRWHTYYSAERFWADFLKPLSLNYPRIKMFYLVFDHNYFLIWSLAFLSKFYLSFHASNFLGKLKYNIYLNTFFYNWEI